MLERIADLPEGIEGFRATGKLTPDDYETVVWPWLASVKRDGRRVRLLYHVGPQFEGFTAGGALEDAKFGLAALPSLEACAVVSDLGWVRRATDLVAFVVPRPVRTFTNAEFQEAVRWLEELPKTGAETHRLVPDAGVIVVEPKGKLRVQDFDRLARTADDWIEAHGKLNGVVIHLRKFPGWENLGSLVRHVQFVRNHHRNVERIAVAADTKLANVAPQIAERFAKAEFKKFPYDALDSAIAWAGRAGQPHPPAWRGS